MEKPEADYPKKKLVWWTIPLTRDGQPGTDAFNAPDPYPTQFAPTHPNPRKPGQFWKCLLLTRRRSRKYESPTRQRIVPETPAREKTSCRESVPCKAGTGLMGNGSAQSVEMERGNG